MFDGLSARTRAALRHEARATGNGPSALAPEAALRLVGVLTAAAVAIAACSESGSFALGNQTGAPLVAHLRWSKAGTLGDEVIAHEIAADRSRRFSVGQLPLDDRLRITSGRCTYVYALSGDQLYGMGDRDGFPVNLRLRRDFVLDIVPSKHRPEWRAPGFPRKALSRTCS